MRSVITDSVVLPASAGRLCEMYLHADEHAKMTGHPVKIAAEPGAVFEAFDGMLSGEILQLIPGQLIVQSWRSAEFREEDDDSTLILMFSAEGEHGRIDLVHLDVPDHDYDDVVVGWKQHYWEPWREYLTSQ